MRAFAEAQPDKSFVRGGLAQLPWCHQLALLDKLLGSETRKWYTAQAIEHNWSCNVLVMQIESRLLQRRGITAANFPATLPAPHSDLGRGSLKDPYRFDFLGPTGEAHKQKIEHAMVRHVTEFRLGPDADFAFAGRPICPMGANPDTAGKRSCDALSHKA